MLDTQSMKNAETEGSVLRASSAWKKGRLVGHDRAR
jgi:hypothetical protein